MTISYEVSHLKRSVMRELLALAVAPDMISLAGGLPAGEYLPLKELQDCMNTVLERDGARAMQYSPAYPPLLRWIVNYMHNRGVECSEDQILITNGAQQGLAILSRLLLDPGQRAIIEETTFTGIQQITAGRGANVHTIPTDLQTGADVEALEEAFSQMPHIRFAVIIPDFHNPLGVSLSAEKRARIAQLAAEYKIPIIEDDPYSALRFAGEALPPIKAYDEADRVFYLGSFSKMFMPAARLGWIIAPPALLPQLTALRESLDLESSTLMQRAVAEFLERGLLEPHLKRLNEGNRLRYEALNSALEEQLGDFATWTKPQGGLFVWLTLPKGVDTWQMFQAAVDQKVAYIPGSAFAVHGGYENTMRLNFSNVTPDNIREGVRRLAQVIDNERVKVRKNGKRQA